MSGTRANSATGGITLKSLFALLSLTKIVSGLHYYAERDKWQCFKDVLASNYTLEMEVMVHDPDVLQTLIESNDELIARGKVANQGVRLRLNDPNDNQLFYGDVHPNVQYEYEAKDPGEYQLCVQLTEMAFTRDNTRIKTGVTFNSEFHRSKSNHFQLHC